MNREAEIIQSLRAAASLTPTLTVKQYQLWSRDRDVPTFLDILNFYGSWTGALKAAGLVESRKQYTQQELVTALRLALEQEGRLTSTHYQQWAKGQAVPSLGDIISHFGSWSLAVKTVERLEELHFTVRPEREKAEIVQSLLEANRVVAPFNAITYQKWAKQHKRPSVAKISRRYGSWKRALAELELRESCDEKK